jgi:hypothetical protein
LTLRSLPEQCIACGYRDWSDLQQTPEGSVEMLKCRLPCIRLRGKLKDTLDRLMLQWSRGQNVKQSGEDFLSGREGCFQ